MTNTTISWIKFENKDIINVIKAADPCKSQGYDDISTTMSKICDSATLKPLAVLFKNCVSNHTFPNNCKKNKYLSHSQNRWWTNSK